MRDAEPSAAASEALIRDFVAWVAEAPRPYDEVMAAWRTSCPRLTVWEDAIDAGYVARVDRVEAGQIVRVTPRGIAFLSAHGRQDSSRNRVFDQYPPVRVRKPAWNLEPIGFGSRFINRRRHRQSAG